MLVPPVCLMAEFVGAEDFGKFGLTGPAAGLALVVAVAGLVAVALGDGRGPTGCGLGTFSEATRGSLGAPPGTGASAFVRWTATC